jgi:hypothetical protein
MFSAVVGLSLPLVATASSGVVAETASPFLETWVSRIYRCLLNIGRLRDTRRVLGNREQLG